MNRNHNLTSSKRDHSLAPFSRNLSDLFEDYARDFFSPAFSEDEGDFMPKIDVKETDTKYLVSAELPGISENNIKISLRENSLVIEGEKKSESKEEEEKGYYRSEIEYGSFYRTVPLKADVDDKNIEAKFQDGVLKVSLTKKNDGISKTIKIPIKH